MIIDDFSAFKGQHCETTATGSLLNQIGIELSEPMLFGLGEGLGFIFWNMKMMDFPFIGGRIKPDVLTENICRNLNLKLEITETSSLKKAWNNIATHLDKRKAVGLKLDCYHLDYFTNKIHFAGHYTAIYGYDSTHAYLIDTDQQGGKVKTTLNNLALARSEKGPMSSKNRAYTISKKNNSYLSDSDDLKKIIQKAIYNNAIDYLNPPIKNISYKGILKASVEIKKWFEISKDIKGDFQTTAMLMERAGTGGSLFRNLYRDFLKESAETTGSSEIYTAYTAFSDIADLWRNIADLFQKAGETSDVKYINKASDLFVEIANQEKKAMEMLESACK